MQNGHSRSFKVTYFDIVEEPLRGYIAQYNKCGLRCEGSEDIASERSEIRHFRPPHSGHSHHPHSTPSLEVTPSNFGMILILAETRVMGLPYGEETMIVGRTIWTQSTSVTERQTELRWLRPRNAQRLAVKIKRSGVGFNSHYFGHVLASLSVLAHFMTS